MTDIKQELKSNDSIVSTPSENSNHLIGVAQDYNINEKLTLNFRGLPATTPSEALNNLAKHEIFHLNYLNLKNSIDETFIKPSDSKPKI